MSNTFFERPILNSPYALPARHWELDEHGQPTQRIVQARRRAEFFTPIPKPSKRKKVAAQEEIIFDEGAELSTKDQPNNTWYESAKKLLGDWWTTRISQQKEIDAEAWTTLNSDVSRPFEKPKKGRIAVKVINHLGDEVMKVFKV